MKLFGATQQQLRTLQRVRRKQLRRDLLAAGVQLEPGVRSDHKGLQYQIGYLRGKQYVVPYENGATEPARMIPAPAEPSRLERPVAIMTTSDGPGEPKRPVLSRRMSILVCRRKGGELLQKYRALLPESHLLNIAAVKPLSRSPDLGKTWIPVEPLVYDMHYFYHFNEGDVDPFQIKEQQ